MFSHSDINSLSSELASSADSLPPEERLDSDLEADLKTFDSVLSTNLSDFDTLSFGSCDKSSNSDFNFDSSKFVFKSKQSTYLRSTILSGVSSQLKSFCSKREVGQPTCLSLRNYLVIGTAKGVILIFDAHQVLRLSFGLPGNSSVEIHSDSSAYEVTSLAQNRDGSRLLSGYLNGRLAVWQLVSSKGVTPDSSMKAVKEQDKDMSISVSNVRTRHSADRFSGELLCVVDDAHGVSKAITLCTFTTISSLIVCVDTGGSAFQVRLKRGLSTVKGESTCFFTGSRGEVCALEALGSSTAIGEHSSYCVSQNPASSGAGKVLCARSLAPHGLICMASFSKLLIVSLRPQIQIMYWRPLQGPSSCLPLLAWRWDYRSCVCRSSSFAVLAFGRGSTIHLLQVSSTVDAKSSSQFGIRTDWEHFKFELSRSISLNDNLVFLKWMPSKSQLATVDILETLHLFDINTEEDIEALDLSSIQLTYHSALYESLRDADAISEALTFVGKRSCVHTIVAHGSQLLFLGQTGVHLVSLLSWSELLQSLFANERFETALMHCKSALDDSRLLDPNANRFDPNAIEEVRINSCPRIDSGMSFCQLQTHIKSMFRQYLLPYLQNSKDNAWILTPNCIQLIFSIADNLMDDEFLFRELYSSLSTDEDWQSCYYVSLFQLIYALPLFGQLSNQPASNSQPDSSGEFLCYRLPPNLSTAFIEWCLNPTYEHHRFRTLNGSCASSDKNIGCMWVEACILRLPPQCLDLNQVVRLCLSRNLFAAYLHLYTDILMDFNTPLRDLFSLLANETANRPYPSSKTLSVDSTIVECVHHLILLLRSGFAGVSYSNEPIPPPLNLDVPLQLLNELVEDAGNRLSNLHLLLQFDSVDFLNMLTLSVSSDVFFCEGELGWDHRSCLYHKLITCCLDSLTCHSGDGDTDFQSYCLDVFLFLVYQLTSESKNRNSTFGLKLSQLFSSLCKHTGRFSTNHLLLLENAVIQMLSFDLLPGLENCLLVAKSAKLYRICEFAHRMRGELDEVFKYQLEKLRELIPLTSLVPDGTASFHFRLPHLSDEVQHLAVQIFAFLERSLSPVGHRIPSLHGRISVGEALQLLLDNVLLFAVVDAERTLQLLCTGYNRPISQIVLMLAPVSYGNSDTTYPESESQNRVACFLMLSTQFRVCNNLGLIDEVLLSVDSEPASLDQNLNAYEPQLIEFYVRLYADLVADESAIVEFLGDKTNYRVDVLLQGLPIDRFPRVVAYLFENSGDYENAFDLHSQIFLKEWRNLIQYATERDDHYNNDSELLVDVTFRGVRSAAESWFAFCERLVSTMLDAQLRESLWFKVVDILMREQSNLIQTDVKTKMNELFYSMLSFASPTISLPTIMLHILQSADSTEAINLNDETNELLTGLVTSCQLEVGQLALNKRLAQKNLTEQQIEMAKKVSNGVCFKRLSCILCGRQILSHLCSDQCTSGGFRKPKEIALAFHCGHLYHRTCSKSLKDDKCPLCSKRVVAVPKFEWQVPGTRCVFACLDYFDDPIRLRPIKTNQAGNPFDVQ